MKNFEFVSHEQFPEDPYIKELVYLCFDNKYRVAYIRKQAKNGGMYWGEISVAVTKDGVRKYFDSFMLDSAFLEKDIKDFLEGRSWQYKAPTTPKNTDDLPF